jgi:hypothetical protein
MSVSPKPVNDAKGNPGERRYWKALSLQLTLRGAADHQQAQIDAGTGLPGIAVYRLVPLPAAVDAAGASTVGPVMDVPDFRKERIPITKKSLVFADPTNRLVLLREQATPKWQKGTLLLG